MAVDASKMAGMRRRGLGSPPKDGAPGLEGIADAGEGMGQSLARTAAAEPVDDVRRPDGKESGDVFEAEEPEAGREGVPQQTKRRVPAPREEARVPFTTRVTVSTKERLEEACYHLRTKHQAFIDEAIRAHLEKNGF